MRSCCLQGASVSCFFTSINIQSSRLSDLWRGAPYVTPKTYLVLNAAEQSAPCAELSENSLHANTNTENAEPMQPFGSRWQPREHMHATRPWWIRVL